MNKEKLRKLEEKVNSINNPPFIIVLQKEGKNYYIDKGEIGKEITADELDQIKSSKIYIDEDDLNA